MIVEISKFAFTQATREADCSKCGAKAGVGCTTPKGRRSPTPHAARCEVYRSKIGQEEFMKRHTIKAMTIAEITAKIVGLA